MPSSIQTLIVSPRQVCYGLNDLSAASRCSHAEAAGAQVSPRLLLLNRRRGISGSRKLAMFAAQRWTCGLVRMVRAAFDGCGAARAGASIDEMDVPLQRRRWTHGRSSN